MSKRIFGARMFRARTFASRTWGPHGADPADGWKSCGMNRVAVAASINRVAVSGELSRVVWAKPQGK